MDNSFILQLSNSRTIRIAVMDGCLFAMEIVGNYINGPLFKQWASEMQKTDLN